MVPSRCRAPVRGAATQGVAMGSAPAMSRWSVDSSSRISTECSGSTASETDFGTSTLGSDSATPALASPAPAAHSPALSASAVTALSATSTEDLFRQYMQAYLEDRQNLAPASAPAPPPADAWEETSDRLLKARNSDLYYSNSHMECYYFCQEWKDYFDTAGAKSHKRVSFAASFLNNRILYCWKQQKARTERSQAVPLSWEEFQAFLRKRLYESNVFVGSVLSRMKGDSQYQLEEVQDWTAHLEQL